MFFTSTWIVVLHAKKQNRMQFSNTTTTTTAKPFTTRVNGAKQLKEYMQEINRYIEAIRYEFQEDLNQPKANVEKTPICRVEYDFNALDCVVSHEDFIYKHTKLVQTSQFLQAENALFECLAHLERIRRMLVNNKQQKKTTIRNIRKIVARETTTTNKYGEHALMIVDDDECFELEYESPTVKQLKHLTELTKQNHHTIAHNLLEQAHVIMREIRSKHILAYKHAAENTVGEIIHHAEKCRAFIMRCRYLALVEYCATVWWLNTQKDSMDQFYYHVSAAYKTNDNELKRFHANTPYTITHTDTMTMIPIVISVYREPVEHLEKSIVCRYDLDPSLMDMIFTEELILSFETAQNEMWYNEQANTQMYANMGMD